MKKATINTPAGDIVLVKHIDGEIDLFSGNDEAEKFALNGMTPMDFHNAGIQKKTGMTWASYLWSECVEGEINEEIAVNLF